MCVAENKKLKSSKKAAELDPDGDGYYIKYDTKCMKVDDIEELNNDTEGDKYIEACGCCASGLEDEHSKSCNNIFFHGGGDQVSSSTPSMEPSGKGKGSSGKRQRREKNRKGLRERK